MMQAYENPLINIAFNIVIPALLLTYLPLHPIATLLIALSFPIGYGIFDFVARKELNFLSAIGFVSVLLTGGIGLLALDARWIAIKEAAVPLTIAIVTVISAQTKDPLVKALLFTDSFLDTKRIAERVHARQAEREFDRTFRIASYLLALSFLFSTVVNYVLARMMVTAPSGSVLFNEQIGRMTVLSFGVIAVPMLVFMVLIGLFIVRKLERITELPWERLLVAEHGSVPDASSDGEEHDADDEPNGESEDRS